MKNILPVKKTWLALLLAASAPTAASGQNSESSYSVIHEVDTVWNFGYKGINLLGRKMHRIDIAYPGKDIEGNDVTLSGYVAIPTEIYDGGQPCDGILLYNHYTQMCKDGAPTRGYAVGEDMVMANPLKPNYIVVASDFQGFGISESLPQAYCFGDGNGRASMDMLLAARKLLEERGQSQGKFLINAGYSSGGFDAIATQRVRDMLYSEQVSFDKTLAGGMPFDVVTAYNEYIKLKDDDTVDATCLPMVLDMYNRHAKLGYTYEEMFKAPYAGKFEEWFLSGKYFTEAIMDSMKNVPLSSVVQDNFLSTSSEEFSKLEEAANAHSLANGWTPDSTQRYYVMHLLRDNVVPINSDRAFLKFLSNTEYDGKKPFTKSLVPERTKLQTNFVIPAKQHTIVGGLVFYLNLAATLTAYPVLYYDGELNTHYADLVKDATLMGIIHKLEEKGFNVKGAVQSLASGETGGSFFEVLINLEKTLNSYGTSTAELLQIADDCGLSIMDIIEIYTYLTTPDEQPAEAPARRSLKTTADETTLEAGEALLTNYYNQRLYDWLKENNVDIYEQE